MRRLFAALLGLCAIAVSPACAHHSMSAYEFLPTVMEGTVQEFRYTNPHSVLVLRIRAENGSTIIWRLEGDPPAMIDRAGFGPGVFKPGDRLKLQVQKLKDGKPGGFWDIKTVIMHNGHEFSGRQCLSGNESCN